MKTRGLVPALGIAAWALANQAAAQWSLEAQAGLRQDSNLGNARFADDTFSDQALVTAVAASEAVFFGRDDSLSWGGRAATETYVRYAGLNNLSLGAFAAFRHKLALGAYAPWLGAAWSSSRLSYVNKVRDGWLHQADFAAGRRFTERWSASATLRLERRTAATQPQAEPGVPGDAFSGHAHALTLGAEYAASANALLSLSGFARRGDVVSVSGDDDRVLAVAKAAAHDGVFGASRYVYRLNGTTHGLGIGLGIALGPRSRLDIGLQHQVTHADGDNTYAKRIAALAWVGSF